jgi:hypothetical protein
MGPQIEAAQADSDTQTEISMVDEEASQTLQGNGQKHFLDSNLTNRKGERIQWLERSSRYVNRLERT